MKTRACVFVLALSLAACTQGLSENVGRVQVDGETYMVKRIYDRDDVSKRETNVQHRVTVGNFELPCTVVNGSLKDCERVVRHLLKNRSQKQPGSAPPAVPGGGTH